MVVSSIIYRLSYMLGGFLAGFLPCINGHVWHWPGGSSRISSSPAARHTASAICGGICANSGWAEAQHPATCSKSNPSTQKVGETKRNEIISESGSTQRMRSCDDKETSQIKWFWPKRWCWSPREGQARSAGNFPQLAEWGSQTWIFWVTCPPWN